MITANTVIETIISMSVKALFVCHLCPVYQRSKTEEIENKIPIFFITSRMLPEKLKD